MSSTITKKARLRPSMVERIEKIGDKFPHPFYLFVYLCLGVMVFSSLLSFIGSEVVHPSTGALVHVKSLISGEGLVFILQSTISNFILFKPLGLILSMMIAVGLLQEVGLADSLIKSSLLNAPHHLITACIFITGIIGNLASDAAFVLIPPLAGLIFSATNRNPVVGICAGFVAVAAGFTANLFIAGTDVLLSGISTEATSIVHHVEVSPAANWYFMLISVPILVITGTILTDKYIEPKFADRMQAHNKDCASTFVVTAQQKVALKWAGVASLIFVALFCLLLWPNDSPLRNAQGGLVPSPFLKGIIPVIMVFFIMNSVVYGLKAGTIKKANDVPELMTKSLRGIGGFIVLAFVIAQFIAWFKWTNLAIFIAVNGAELISAVHMPNLLMMAVFMILAGVMNLFIYSGSAQWAIMAPVFIPLFMLIGISPEVTQMGYRIADSTTNIISPTNPYIPMVLALIAKYNPNVKFGTFLAIMLPYALVLFGVWAACFLAYMLSGLPVGPL